MSILHKENLAENVGDFAIFSDFNTAGVRNTKLRLDCEGIQ